MSSTPLAPTPRTTLRRLPERGSFKRAQLEAILDEALVCHVGFVEGGQPFVIPTTFARVGETLYIHGSAASRMLRELREGIPVCVTVTLLDGLVLARSAFHHSMNYRSVVVLGTATEVTDLAEKGRALEAIVEHVVPGRSADVRGPNEKEMRGTLVLALPLTEASCKVRSGPPKDEEVDYAIPCWAGEIPLRLVPQPLVADPKLAPGISAPPTVTAYKRPSHPR